MPQGASTGLQERPSSFTILALVGSELWGSQDGSDAPAAALTTTLVRPACHQTEQKRATKQLDGLPELVQR